MRKLQLLKKHSDTRITEEPSMREATINYDDPARLTTESKTITSESSKAKSPSPNKSSRKNDAADNTTDNAASNTKGVAGSASDASNQSWSASQQTQLERALQEYPKDYKGSADRWDLIAAAVEGKTKKECRARVKVRGRFKPFETSLPIN